MKALIATEMALSLVLLVGAGLLTRSALRMSTEPLGFESHGLVTAGVTLPVEGYRGVAHRLQFYDRLVRVPGDKAALSAPTPRRGC